MLSPSLSRLAVAAVLALITVDAYASQYFLLAPVLGSRQLLRFNAILLATYITYVRTVLTNPGSPPKDWVPTELEHESADAEEGHGHGEPVRLVSAGSRWCRKCNAWKPPRAHHCKACGRCILRMDHHCPWSANCIGYRNLPHFIRFLVYGVWAASYNGLWLISMSWEVWEARKQPSSTTPHNLVALVLLGILNSFLFMTMLLLCLRTLHQTVFGATTIEGWEQDRHDALVRRRVVKQVTFPYDIGFWENVVAAFGYSSNPISWANPLARSPRIAAPKCVGASGPAFTITAGLEWEVNGFEAPGTPWPPRDPDKLSRPLRPGPINEDTATQPLLQGSDDIDVAAFRRRQADDLMRRRRPPPQRENTTPQDEDDENIFGYAMAQRDADGEVREHDWLGDDGGDDGRYSFAGMNALDLGRSLPAEWRNEEGETLADYGVDVAAEEEDEEDEDVPLAELVRRRRRGKGWAGASDSVSGKVLPEKSQ